jgi:hypothetical protein
VDQPAQGVGDLAGPDRVRIGFGGVGKITQQVGRAERVDDAGESRGDKS